jgi:hypothetical protein
MIGDNLGALRSPDMDKTHAKCVFDESEGFGLMKDRFERLEEEEKLSSCLKGSF